MQDMEVAMDTITTSIRTDAQHKREADHIANDPDAKDFATVYELFADLDA